MSIVRQGLFVVALLASSAAYAGAPGWSVSESSGQVTIASTGLVKAALRGGSLATGDIVSTGRTGRAVLVRGEEYLIVAPNSRLRVADPVKSGGMTQIIEQFGNVIFKIKKMTMPHFAVETPFLAAVVKGTTFSVTVTDKGASVQVIEGRVEVATRDGGASYMVLPGDIGSVSATAPGRLDVQGHEPKSIDSPTPAAAAAAVTASVAESPGPAGDVQLSGTIEAPVGEGAVNLASMTDGMVKGDSSMMAMVAMMSESSREPEPVAATTGSVAIAVNDPTPLTADAETVPVPLPPVAETVGALPPTPVAGGETVDVVAAPGSKPVNATVTAMPPAPAAAPVIVVATVTAPAAIGNGNGNNGNGGPGNGNGFTFGNNGNSGRNGNNNSWNGNNGQGNNNGNSGHSR